MTRSLPDLARVALLALWCLLPPSLVSAHGGLPVSEVIVRRGDRLLVPTLYWGVFFGQDPAAGGGPWRWICEEAINMQQARKWALGAGGTYHVTDYSGITSSRDGGCTWVAATGEIATRSTAGLVADPSDGKRAWAATDQGASAPWNALFTTADDGLTWTPVMQADEYLKGPAISADGQTIYLTGLSRPAGARVVTLHVSRDGGKSFTDTPIQFSVDGAPQTTIEPLAVDPRDPSVAWLAVRAGGIQELVKATGYGMELLEQFRLPAAIGGVSFDRKRDAVLVPVAPLGGGTLEAGLMRSVGGGVFKPFSDLSRAQCVFPDGDVIYACSWNFLPDNKAVARSDDGGAHFTRVFQYADTAGPTTDCAPSTPVGTICPQVWRMYAPQLGIAVAGADMAVPDGGPVTPPGGSCAVASRPRSPSSRAALPTMALCLVLVLVLALVRLRRRPARAYFAAGSSTSASG